MTQRYQEERQGLNRGFVVPADETFAPERFTGQMLSAHAVSGSDLTLIAVSSPVRLRPLHLEFYNHDTIWSLIELRDGSHGGTLVVAPFIVNGQDRRTIPPEEIKGAYFTSAIVPVFVSGGAAAPISRGIQITGVLIKETISVSGRVPEGVV